MKDYSINLEEKKDFILGYDITSDGMIKIKFAKGNPWIVPYNEENEKKILEKMKKQLENKSVYEEKIKEKTLISRLVSVMTFLASLYIVVMSLNVSGLTLYSLVCIAGALVCSSALFTIIAVKNNNKLKDLRKNIRFLEMEEKLNNNVRSEENILVNVSSKTKNAIKDFPEDKPIFNINSFNYVPFSDLEQIIENVKRNERLGFNYEEKEEPVKGVVRKKIR